MRRLSPEEVAQRLAAGRARSERVSAQTTRRPTSVQLEQAIERAEAALALVIRDVESTTSVRDQAAILRYDDWVLDKDPNSWLLHDGDPQEEDEGLDEVDDDELALACRFGGHTFALDGDQSIAELASDIAFQVQDDVTDDIGAAWPECPGHPHPMSPAVAGEEALWTCPSDADVTMAIGELAAGFGLI